MYTGAFASTQEIPLRQKLALTEDQFSLSAYSDSGDKASFDSLKEKIESEKTTKYSFAYGPHEAYREVFSKLGHLHYGESEGNYQPFLFLEGGQLIPHIALRPFLDLRLEKSRVQVNGNSIPVKLGELVPIDFPSRDAISANTLSLVNLLGPTPPNAKLGKVTSESFVFLVPLHYTGHTDFKPSPVGLIPGSFAHIAVLNSILMGKGLSYQGGGSYLILAFCLLLFGISRKLKPAGLLISIFGLALLWFLVYVFSFIQLGTILPFLWPLLALLMVGLCLLAQRIYVFDRNAQIIRSALEGVVRPQSLKALERNPEKLALHSRERVVTIVFIDIVGFSLIMNSKAPEQAFSGLQDVVERISACIHKHGGIVNKTLGDGLLCFFGYSVEDDSEISGHAEAALQAALEIQFHSIAQILSDAEQKKPLFPLRIGINTSKAYIGNVGAGDRIDITLIGSGVNHAKRLEAACRTNCVLIGVGTQDKILAQAKFGEPHRRFVYIKHHDEQVECWEYEPLVDDQSQIIKATDIAEREAVVHSTVQRWNPNNAIEIRVLSSLGNGKLVNFWATGFKFMSDELIPRHTKFDIRLGSSDGKFEDSLKAQGLNDLTVVVSSVGYSNSKYYHEVRYITPEGKKALMIAEILDRMSGKR